MSSLHAPYCADQAVQIATQIDQLERVAQDTYRIRFSASEIAGRVVPGQFVMIRHAMGDDPLIGRAFAMYDIYSNSAGNLEGLDIVFVAKGKLTKALVSTGVGTRLSVWGPLGNSFSDAATDHLIIAVGGVGQTPMLALASEALGKRSFGSGRVNGYAKRVTMVYGARTKDLLASLEAFRSTGMELILCTDDGSAGRRGRVPDVLREVLGQDQTSDKRCVTCGPEIMMQKVSEVAAEHQIPCEVSLETPMACGIGICFSCVARVSQPDGRWDYKRTCVEGPIFDANQLVW